MMACHYKHLNLNWLLILNRLYFNLSDKHDWETLFSTASLLTYIIIYIYINLLF